LVKDSSPQVITSIPNGAGKQNQQKLFIKELGKRPVGTVLMP